MFLCFLEVPFLCLRVSDGEQRQDLPALGFNPRLVCGNELQGEGPQTSPLLGRLQSSSWESQVQLITP